MDSFILILVLFVIPGLMVLFIMLEDKEPKLSKKYIKKQKAKEEKQKAKEELRTTLLYSLILARSSDVIDRELKRVPLKIEKLPFERWHSCIHIRVLEEKCLIENQYKPSDSFNVDYKKCLNQEERSYIKEFLRQDLKDKYPQLYIDSGLTVNFEKLYPKDKIRGSALYRKMLETSCKAIDRTIRRIPGRIAMLPPSKWYSYLSVTVKEEECFVYDQQEKEKFTICYKDYGPKYLFSEEAYKFFYNLQDDLKEKYPELDFDAPGVYYNTNYGFTISFRKIYEKHKPKSNY